VLDEADLKLKDWAATVLEKTPVSFDAPTTPREGEGVGMYLLEIADAFLPRSQRRAPLQVKLRYLVTTWASDAARAHHLLGQLLFAALEHEEYGVALAPPPASLWTAFGLSPRPSFILELPFRRERPEPKAPRVREVLTQSVLAVPFVGRVLGPGDIPIPGAVVELPKTELFAETDADGWFRFPRVPSEPRARLLRVRAKGEVRAYTVENALAEGEPVTIRFPLED